MSGYGDEEGKVIVRLWTDGHSASSIAERVNVAFRTGRSRNAIIGFLHRKGLTRGTTQTRPRTRRFDTLTQAQRHQMRMDREARRPSNGSLRPPRPRNQRQVPPWQVPPDQRPIVEDDPTKAARLVALVDLEPGDCRWPIGDPRLQPFGFCGEKAIPGLPYCSGHAHRAYRIPEGTQPRPPAPLPAATVKTPETVQ